MSENNFNITPEMLNNLSEIIKNNNLEQIANNLNFSKLRESLSKSSSSSNFGNHEPNFSESEINFSDTKNHPSKEFNEKIKKDDLSKDVNFSKSSYSDEFNTKTPNDLNIDLNTILKIKSVLENLNNKDDPRSNLLYSLKPYLNKNKQKKIDQYVNILKFTDIANFLKTEKGDES